MRKILPVIGLFLGVLITVFGCFLVLPMAFLEVEYFFLGGLVGILGVYVVSVSIHHLEEL